MNEPSKESVHQDGLTLSHILFILRANRKFISLITLLACILTIVYSLNVKKLYESSAILLPVSNNSTPTATNSLLNSLGSQIPFDVLGNNSTVSIIELAILKSRSRDFLRDLLKEEYVARNLIAESNLEISLEDINNSFYFERLFTFYRNSFKASKNRLDNYYIVQYISTDPSMSKDMLEIILSKLDKYIKEDEKQKSESKLLFFNSSITSPNNTVIVTQVLSQLIEKEFIKLSSFNENQDYAFNIIDTPYLNPFRIYPKRSTMVVLAFFISILISSFFSIIYHLFFRKAIY